MLDVSESVATSIKGFGGTMCSVTGHSGRSRGPGERRDTLAQEQRRWQLWSIVILQCVRAVSVFPSVD
ncbi:hypothetical protein F2P81_015019 [Scophthalmus maximus]|uniref:Uncharacterized protein n=1 Tax=Scophthalmus maximus TaxID=52904 RepID=A0A6A4SJL3_SCOMX|nr:hypothetical protein F2P81_015019 [Scophthalmus maximus]